MDLENKILKMYKKNNLNAKQQRILDIIKVILIDNEKSLDNILFKAGTTVKTIKKYIEEKEAVMEFLNEQEFLMLRDRFYSIKEKNYDKSHKRDGMFSKESHKQNELVYIKKIIDDIFKTRHKIRIICENNYLPSEKVKKLFYETNFLEENFGIGMKEKVKAKIAENGLRHEQTPKDKFLIEDRWDVFITNPNVLFVDQFDYKRIKFASNYLCSGADINSVVGKYETTIPSFLTTLSDLKLKELLKPEHFETLRRYISIEKVLTNNELTAKKTLLFNVVHVLKDNNYDFDLTLTYLNLPINLFNRLLDEILMLPHFNDEVKSQIKNLRSNEDGKKGKIK